MLNVLSFTVCVLRFVRCAVCLFCVLSCVGCGALFVVRCPLCVVRWSLFVVRCLLLVVINC